jgi:methionyl aminopeptidase
MSYIEASDTSLRKTGQIKLHGPSGFAGMRKAGALVAKCLDELTDIVKPGAPTSRSTISSASSPSAMAPTRRR